MSDLMTPGTCQCCLVHCAFCRLMSLIYRTDNNGPAAQSQPNSRCPSKQCMKSQSPSFIKYNRENPRACRVQCTMLQPGRGRTELAWIQVTGTRVLEQCKCWLRGRQTPGVLADMVWGSTFLMGKTGVAHLHTAPQSQGPKHIAKDSHPREF